MVNGGTAFLPFTIYHLPFTNLLLLVLLFLHGGLFAGRLLLVLVGGLHLLFVLVEERLDGSLVVVGRLDEGVLAQAAQVGVVLLLGALLRQRAADEVLVEGVVARVDAQDHVALVGLDRLGDLARLQVLDGVGDWPLHVRDEVEARLAALVQVLPLRLVGDAHALLVLAL